MVTDLLLLSTASSDDIEPYMILNPHGEEKLHAKLLSILLM